MEIQGFCLFVQGSTHGLCRCDLVSGTQLLDGDQLHLAKCRVENNYCTVANLSSQIILGAVTHTHTLILHK